MAGGTQVVGIAKGDPPCKCRFDESQAAAVKALRVSLHLNLAAGALKLSENYGALAAARVARELEPRAVKPLYREAQAHLALQDYPATRETLKLLLEIEPQNAAARKLAAEAKKGQDALKAAQKRSFVGLFSRAHKEGRPLYTKDEIERIRTAGLQPTTSVMTMRPSFVCTPGSALTRVRWSNVGVLLRAGTTSEEKKRTQFQADRAEERRRGVVAMDTKELSRLPEEYQQKEIDSMNEAIENDTRTSKVPEGMSEEQFKRILQMRTDGENEDKVQAELWRMRREEMAAVKKHMLREEIERMAERQAACERDRYKSDEVVAERQEELWDEFKEIQRRVERRVPLMDAESKRQEQQARIASP